MNVGFEGTQIRKQNNLGSPVCKRKQEKAKSQQ